MNVLLIVKFIFVFQANTEVLSYWAVKTLEDLQFTSRGLDPGVKCKMHAIPILMHQMRISVAYISSVMVRSKSLDIRNIMTVKTLIKVF
jgi:hypothetical protein